MRFGEKGGGLRDQVEQALVDEVVVVLLRRHRLVLPLYRVKDSYKARRVYTLSGREGGSEGRTEGGREKIVCSCV